MKNRDVYEEIIRQTEPGMERAVLRVVSMHVGAENAISREQLAGAVTHLGFGRNANQVTFDRKLRMAISSLRKLGVLICSSSGDHGYYIARDQEEYETFAAAEYRSKISDMATTLRAMDQAAEQRFGKRPPAGQEALF